MAAVISAEKEKPLARIWEVPDELWDRLKPIILRHFLPARTGRPRTDLRRVVKRSSSGYVRGASGTHWREFGDDSTVHRWFQAFVKASVFEEIWAVLVAECERLGNLGWTWQAADGMISKARMGGAKRGSNPTDRAKPATKKSLIVERRGGPLGLEIDGANVHDTKLLEATIETIVLKRHDPQELTQHLCLDKAYDNPTGEAAGYVPHIRCIGKEKLDARGEKRHPARRWVVEPTLAWLSKCRAILIRYDKKPANYKGLIQLACTLLWCRRLHTLGWGHKGVSR